MTRRLVEVDDRRFERFELFRVVSERLSELVQGDMCTLD
jgi:hypothetical protein